jgi:hypothetical protein
MLDNGQNHDIHILVLWGFIDPFHTCVLSVYKLIGIFAGFNPGRILYNIILYIS